MSGFKKPGKDGMGIYRAVLVSGPPGIGKTTSAHLMAKMAGYSPIELNASDARSKKLVEVCDVSTSRCDELNVVQNYTNIDNTSLDGFFQGTGMKVCTLGLKPVLSLTTTIEHDGYRGYQGGLQDVLDNGRSRWYVCRRSRWCWRAQRIDQEDKSESAPV